MIKVIVIMMLCFCASSANSGDGEEKEIVFVGDSRTYMLPLSSLPYTGINCGIPGATIQTCATNINRYISYNPDEFVIAIGINDVCLAVVGGVAQYVQYFAYNYSALVSYIHSQKPNAKIYLVSLFFVNSRYHSSWYAINCNCVILNSWIQQYALMNGFTYIDIATPLANGTSALWYNYDDGSGIHLNSTANNIIINKYKEVIK